MRILLAWALFLALPSTGCSIFLTAPEEAPREEELNCQARGIAPVLDTFAAVAGVVGGIFVIAADQTSSCDPNTDFCFKGLPTAGIGIPALLIGSIYTLAAVHGWQRNTECREHNARIAHTRTARAGAVGIFCIQGTAIESAEICEADQRCIDGHCVSP